MLQTAVLVSGRGSNLKALLDAKAAGRLPYVNICCVISNKADAPALDIARAQGIPAIAVPHKDFAGNRAAHDAAMVQELRRRGAEFVVLAGYMRLLTPVFIDAFRDRVINVHPSLLPAFPGVDAPRQAVAAGVKIAGCTVHFVTQEMDGGPIIVQRTVPVRPDDDDLTLATRILEEEHQALPFALDLVSRNRVKVMGRRVIVIPGDSSYGELDRAISAYMPVLVATGNHHKVEEIRHILAELALSWLTTDLFPNLPEPVEDAPDFEGNSLIKAREWRDRSGMWTLADDSGLVIDALGGRPGIHSARYAETSQGRIDRVLAEMRDVPDDMRTARFICVVTLVSPDGREFIGRGVCEGHIAREQVGAGGFGYDPIFVPEGFDGTTLAQLGEYVKNNISHRARALFVLKPILERLARRQL